MITKKRKNNQIKIDKIILFLWPIIASIISLLTKANFFLSIIIYLLIPSLFLSYKNSRYINKSLIFSGVALPILIVIDYISVNTGTWYFPVSVIDYRFFGNVTLEVLLWFYIWVYLIVMYYEYFLDKKCSPKLYSPRLKYPFIAFLIIFVLFLTLVKYNVSIYIPYFYLIFGTIMAIIPLILVLTKFPNLFVKFAKATVYFLYFSFLWELTAISLDQWTFPGNYFIGWIDIFGLRFPFEEFLVWIFLGSAAILSWYEFFDDDQK